MKLYKYLTIAFLLISFAFSEHRKHKSRKHKKYNTYHVVKHRKPKVHLGFHWHLNRWNHWGHRWHNCGCRQKVVVVKEQKEKKDEHESVLQIIEEIEKLAELKEKGHITEKEYQKKKKELLKRI